MRKKQRYEDHNRIGIIEASGTRHRHTSSTGSPALELGPVELELLKLLAQSAISLFQFLTLLAVVLLILPFFGFTSVSHVGPGRMVRLNNPIKPFAKSCTKNVNTLSASIYKERSVPLYYNRS